MRLFVKQKTAYEMRISDWSSDVCSSDLRLLGSDSSWRSATALNTRGFSAIQATAIRLTDPRAAMAMMTPRRNRMARAGLVRIAKVSGSTFGAGELTASLMSARSEEHTSELQSLMRLSYAVFCLSKQIHSSRTQTSSPPILPYSP